ncbi:HAD-IA family hydrolase [Chromobacterium subtsugae]|uniref:HAD-IA family hydrolase n=3 Tax=Chromobacterium subtsugae TaxID=251747 RepID=A0ABS7FGZ2_9NEIS|nr:MULTISPECIES: HAD-IA family hydrolase [Chromobacterium]KUM04400.1 phosphoglycolate phosphatase [Chromobacterium subtsugae]KZE87351.1 phosphoglycolate phosphatase [Chromobacterium sp. F49]MBW7568402.1 HAD-IA family hydrolase [Chromobacterium subtsugae]MBW8289334.1 HAD-IA family hydrolase [Chromobacterium subtsugae]WSE93351.1 HAD-IA family hydrolase [Chromobacterium subtsugae]
MIKAVLFDLDGTLADTARDLGAALNRLLKEEGLPPQPYEAIRPMASHGARGLVRLGFGAGLDAERMESLRVRFMDLYDASLAEETTLFDGVNELIAELDKRGLAWGIITNKSMRFTDRLVPWLPFAIPPAVIVSGDTVGVAKPDPRPMLHATEQIGIAPEHCMYVGDAERDIQAGRNVGMKTVLVNWGYFSADDKPEQWGADADIDHPLQLLDHL